MNNRSRREFIMSVAGGALAAGAATGLTARVLAQGAGGGGKVEEKGGVSVERRQFGKTDMKVSTLGFGGAEIGFQQAGQATVEELLNAALDLGLNVIDTAECYADSEELIGNAVSHRRKDYYVFTKVGHFKAGKVDWSGDWTKDGILASIVRSLKRLKTDHVDLVQLHSCGLDTLKKGECIEALEEAKKSGKTRYIGYSGDSLAAKYAIETGRFDTLQTSLSIADQESIDLLLPLAREKNMGVICKRPIANAAWRYDELKESEYWAEYWRRLQKLDYDFLKGDAKKKEGPDGPAGIALRFTLSQPGVHTAIVGTSNPKRWKQNAELLAAGPLPKATLDKIHARWKEVAGKDWTGQT